MIQFTQLNNNQGDVINQQTKLRTFKIVDGYCVDESGMRVGSVVREMVKGPETDWFKTFVGYNVSNVEFFDDRFFQSNLQCLDRLTSTPIANIIDNECT